MQKTKFDLLLKQLIDGFSFTINGSWRRRTYGIIFLLFGFYIGSILTVLFLERTNNRPLIVILMVVILELMVRIRNVKFTKSFPVLILAIDNLRIGSLYAVVLEAFKLGS